MLCLFDIICFSETCTVQVLLYLLHVLGYELKLILNVWDKSKHYKCYLVDSDHCFYLHKSDHEF